MSVSDSDRAKAVGLLMNAVLHEGSTRSDEKRQIAMRLAERKEQEVFARSNRDAVAYKALLNRLIADISQIKRQGPSNSDASNMVPIAPAASASVSAMSLASHSQDKKVDASSSKEVIAEFWKVLEELKAFTSLIDKLLVKQEAKIKGFPPGDPRLGGEEKKLLDLKKLRVVISCKKTDAGIDEKLESHNPDKVTKLKRHLDALKQMLPPSSHISGQEDEMSKRRLRAYEVTDPVKKAVEDGLSSAQATLEPLGVSLKLIESNPSLATDEVRRFFTAECQTEDQGHKLMVRINIGQKGEASSAEALFRSSDSSFFADPKTSILRSLLEQSQPKDLSELISIWRALVTKH